MKKVILKSIGLAAISISIFLIGCSKEESLITPSSESTQVSSSNQSSLTFKGMKINHVANVPEEVLEFSEEDFQNHFVEEINKSTHSRNITSIDEYSYPDLDQLEEAMNQVDVYVPNFGDLSDDDLTLIRSVFGELTEDEIFKHLDVIEEYFMLEYQYELISELKDENFTSSGSRVYYPGRLCGKEFWALFFRYGSVNAVKRASNEALDWAREDFPTTYRTKGDAFRHCLWNALIVKYYGEKRKNKEKALKLAEVFTNKHEDCSTDDDFDIEMDLHNNVYGRNYIKPLVSVTGTRRNKTFNSPSSVTIRSTLKSRAKNNSRKVATTVGAVRAISYSYLVYFNN